MDKKTTISNDTTSSNPVDIEVKPLVWFRHSPTIGIFLCLLFILSIVGLYYDIRSIAFIIVVIVMTTFHWMGVKKHFQADSNPGLVVSTQPTLVAVHTDLTKGVGSYPAIKIIKCSKLKGVHVGDMLPTVASYQNYEELDFPFWPNFNPIPVRYATDDKNTINKAMQSYSKSQLQNLKQHIKQIEPPYEEGLYLIHTEDSDWNESEH